MVDIEQNSPESIDKHTPARLIAANTSQYIDDLYN